MAGFQLWVNLAAKDKMQPPAYRDIAPAGVPVLTTRRGRDGARHRRQQPRRRAARSSGRPPSRSSSTSRCPRAGRSRPRSRPGTTRSPTSTPARSMIGDAGASTRVEVERMAIARQRRRRERRSPGGARRAESRRGCCWSPAGRWRADRPARAVRDEHDRRAASGGERLPARRARHLSRAALRGSRSAPRSSRRWYASPPIRVLDATLTCRARSSKKPASIPRSANRSATLNADIVHNVQAAAQLEPGAGGRHGRQPARAPRPQARSTAAGVAYHYLEYGSYLSEWRRRNALKMWTGWPTFPMVFVKGTLVGGGKEIEALIESGELEAHASANEARRTRRRARWPRHGGRPPAPAAASAAAADAAPAGADANATSPASATACCAAASSGRSTRRVPSAAASRSTTSSCRRWRGGSCPTRCSSSPAGPGRARSTLAPQRDGAVQPAQQPARHRLRRPARHRRLGAAGVQGSERRDARRAGRARAPATRLIAECKATLLKQPYLKSESDLRLLHHHDRGPGPRCGAAPARRRAHRPDRRLVRDAGRARDACASFRQTVRRTVLDGVAPPDMALAGELFAPTTRRRSIALAAACAAEPACAEAIPTCAPASPRCCRACRARSRRAHPLTGSRRAVHADARACVLGAVRGALYIAGAGARPCPRRSTPRRAATIAGLVGLSATRRSRKAMRPRHRHAPLGRLRRGPAAAARQTGDKPGSEFGSAFAARLYEKLCAVWPRGAVPGGVLLAAARVRSATLRAERRHRSGDAAAPRRARRQGARAAGAARRRRQRRPWRDRRSAACATSIFRFVDAERAIADAAGGRRRLRRQGAAAAGVVPAARPGDVASEPGADDRGQRRCRRPIARRRERHGGCGVGSLGLGGKRGAAAHRPRGARRQLQRARTAASPACSARTAPARRRPCACSPG